MKKTKKAIAQKDSKKEFLKDMYEDFKSTMKVVLGDFEETIGKHKLLLIFSFLAFLLYRNKQFTVDQFVQKLEKKLLDSEQSE